MADHSAQHPAGDRHDRPGQYRGEDSAEPDGDAHVPGQELRGCCGRGRCRFCAATGGPRAHDAVDEADGEVEAVLVLQRLASSFAERDPWSWRPLRPGRGEGDRVVGQADREARAVLILFVMAQE